MVFRVVSNDPVSFILGSLQNTVIKKKRVYKEYRGKYRQVIPIGVYLNLLRSVWEYWEFENIENYRNFKKKLF